jgi:hypothetical protein
MPELKVKWEKWTDPFNNVDKDEDDDNSFDFEKKKFGNSIGQAVVGPMGIIPLNESCYPGKLYNFWNMHTNFDVTEAVADVLNEMPGVETLDIFTRYRVRLAFGKCFEEREIKRAIEKVLTEQPKPPEETTDKLSVIKNSLGRKYKYWCIITTKEGKMFTYGDDTQEKIEEKIDECQEIENVYLSWS